MAPLATSSETAKFDLSLSIGHEGGALVFRRDLFDRTTADRWTRQFQTLVAGALGQPAQALSELPVLAAAERHQLLAEGNDTAGPVPGSATLDAVFEASASARPRAQAVVYGREKLTFRELNGRSNQLARFLRSLGVGRGTLVGLALPRSLEMVVGLLAVLKAGGAYVPLDVEHPEGRLSYQSADAGLAWILTGGGSAELLRRVAPAAQVVEVELEHWSFYAQSSRNLGLPVDARDLAYVLYTSGSTGRPKAVQVEHGSVLNLLAGLGHEIYGDRPRLRIGVNASLTFDASMKQVLQMVVGHTVIVVPEEIRLDASALRAYLRETRMQALDFTPSQLQLLANDLLRSEAPTSLKTLLVGGEALDPGLWQRLAADFKGDVFNVYGPTECTVDTLTKRVQRGQGPALGRPLTNVRTYVLSSSLLLQPRGAAGELGIGGSGVSRGYLGRPGLTAERFVPDPFSGESGGRLYRTGDLSRSASSGDLEFLGRLDHQVKLRGFRIELGEIESVLTGQLGIRSAVVVVRDSEATGPGLVAYLLPKEEEAPSVEELKSALSRELPPQMVPTAWVFLDELPLTPSGKVDRRALPEPELSGGLQGSAYVAPRDSIESGLVRIFEDLVGRTSIGVQESFFALGGHSLLAIQLLARIERDLALTLPLAAIFQDPSIEGLASRLRTQSEPEARFEEDSVLVPLQKDGDGLPLFLVHAIGGGAFSYLALSAELRGRQPIYAFQAEGLLAGRETQTDILAMARNYLELVKEVQPEGPYAVAGWSMGGLIALEMGRALRAAGEQVSSLILIDSFVQPYAETDSLLSFFRGFADAMGLAVQGLQVTEEELMDLPEGERLAFLEQRVKAIGALPRDFPLTRLERLLSVYRANQLALRRYRVLPYSGAVTLLQAHDATTQNRERQTAAWGGVVADLRVRGVPGDHFSALKPPQVKILAKEVRNTIEGDEGVSRRSPKALSGRYGDDS
jgi:amino acid adenylation domain-containing protein